MTDDPLCAHAPYVITLGVFDELLAATKSSTGEKFFIWTWKPERVDWGDWSMHFFGRGGRGYLTVIRKDMYYSAER